MEERKTDKIQAGPTTSKTCQYCKAEVPVSARKCSHCGSSLISARPIVILLVLVLLILGVWANLTPDKTQQIINVPAGSDSSAGSVQKTIPLNNNNPSIKQLGTITVDYVGKSFVIDVNAETVRYYNYGFDDETKYYSLKIWDDSVGGDWGGVYAYLDKNDTNKQLVNALFNSSVKLEVHASIPASHYKNDSNAFLKIDSWKMLQ